jgi:large subunit ribosomal protein L4e
MKIKIFAKDGSEKGNIELPKIFEESVRKDIIRRAVTAIQTNKRQAYGANPEAGKRVSAKLSRRRHDYRCSYGHGISRVPRKIMSRRGTRFNWVAALAPGTVGGRRAHPPKAEKVYDVKINKKERLLAIRSAISASMKKEVVLERGHNIPESYPFIIDTDFEGISKTKELIDSLSKLGFSEELKRTSVRKIRAGKGKMRGRRYKNKIGPLLVTSDKSDLEKATRNIPGFECVTVKSLNAELLAPGSEAGRVVLFSKSAIEKITKEKMFTNEHLINKE